MDQLYLAMTHQNRYPAYVEFPITFRPTYKRNKIEHDLFHNKKNQAPSYTDRILYRNNNSTPGSTEVNAHSAGDITLKAYACLENVRGSDHRPVVLDIIVKVNELNYMDETSLIDIRKAKS